MRGFGLQEKFVTQVRCQNMKFAVYKTIGVHMGPANFLVPKYIFLSTLFCNYIEKAS